MLNPKARMCLPGASRRLLIRCVFQCTTYQYPIYINAAALSINGQKDGQGYLCKVPG